MDAALKDNVLNFTKIRSKMKDKPTKYKLYNFFAGMPDMLTLDQAKDIKKISEKEHERFIKALDKEISKIEKSLA